MPRLTGLVSAAVPVLLAIALTLEATPAGAEQASNTPVISEAEYVSLACIVGSSIAGTATVLAGSVAIVATGGMATATQSAVAVPVLVATIAAGCGVAQSMAPGIAWLRRQGNQLVEKLDRIEPPWTGQ